MVVKNHFELGYKEEAFNRRKLDAVGFKQISTAGNDLLVSPFSIEEIKEVVWECDRNKSLGPDGFNLNFIKSC